jgi:hypothetical protein
MIRRGIAGVLGLFGFVLLIGAGFSKSSFVPSPLTVALTALGVPAAGTDTKDVIVILRDQMNEVPGKRGEHQARANALSASQDSHINPLQTARSRKVTKFRTINAFATSVSKAESDHLSANPEVQAVVPDAVIRLKQPTRNRRTAGSTTSAANPSPVADASGLCGTLEPEALQLTNAAFLDPSKPQAQRVRDGNGEFVTGKGVKVAIIADGLDPNVQGFIRPDGTSVFIDYKNFGNQPPGFPTPGLEAFGDASSIAAQDMPNGVLLTFDISQFVNPAHPLPSPCNIQIRGISPGASLVALDLSGSLTGFSSEAVQAIEYAVVDDDVDVINESFGSNPFPDNENDPVALANTAAVSAGVTVVVSSGDSGLGTLDSSSTNPNVIAAGASTQFRNYAQTGAGAAPWATGYISNNISAFSSGGFAQLAPRTVDVVAPGDYSWALGSTNQSLYFYCGNYNNFSPSPIVGFGGTSESAPLIAGEAALIIQAYRSTHHNADPSPALVKNIIMSTATDLGAPSDEQGAGLINTLAAVQAALSIADTHGTPSRQGNGLLITPQSATIVAAPNTPEAKVFTVTNTGSATQHFAPKLQKLGPAIAGATLNLTLAPGSDPTILGVLGDSNSCITEHFTVPANAQHLDTAIAWQNPIGGSSTVAYGLLDPAGRNAAFSFPDGEGSSYGRADVVAPAAGNWTAIVCTLTSDPSTYSGPVKFTWAAERFVDFGSVSPAAINLAPGASTAITTTFSMPSQPGDMAIGLRLNPSSGGSSNNEPEVPITLRTLVPLGPNGGSFTGTLTGGNGLLGPYQTFEFDVPGAPTSSSHDPKHGSDGPSNMSLDLHIADSGYLLEGLLVDPQGMQLSVQGNVDVNGNVQGTLQQFCDHPQPGRWHFVLLQNFYSSGNQTSLPFTAHVRFNSAEYSAPHVPNNPHHRISASAGPVTIPISVTNNGALTEWYFADIRLDTLAIEQLSTGLCSNTQTLPGICIYTFLPPEVAGVAFVSQSSVPITMDAVNLAGEGGYFSGPTFGLTQSPDLYARSVGNNTVVASLSKPEVPWGEWVIFPSLIGPYGPSGPPTEPVQTSVFALMKPFDSTMVADTGDAWLVLVSGSDIFNPLVLAPGQSGTINLTITPDPSKIGQTVKGYIYLDTYSNVFFTGDEVARIPYSYTISP